MIELAYKTPAGVNKRTDCERIYLKIGDTVYPSIVEFSGDEVKLSVYNWKEKLIATANKGKCFFK